MMVGLFVRLNTFICRRSCVVIWRLRDCIRLSRAVNYAQQNTFWEGIQDKDRSRSE